MMLNNIKGNRSLFSKFLYHSITLEVFFHWFTFVISCICWLILSGVILFIFLILDIEGFIKQHEILFGKSSLWSLIVIYTYINIIIFQIKD